MSIAPTGLSRLFREPAPDPNVSATPSAALDGPALAAVIRIVELQLRQVPLDTLTAEVLPAMLAVFDAPAGALLLYRREDATLTLAAARGLAVTGAEALDVLRRGDERKSEMPLRALADRKIYVVDRPQDDVFTRKLTGPAERRSLSAVAAVPLYRWQLPVGVMLVIGEQASLASDALLAPSFAYSVLALALSTMLWARDDRGATPLPASDVAPPPLICVPWVDHRHETSSELARLEAERDAGIAAVRAEGRVPLEAGIAAAREESRSTIEVMLQELRAAVSGMEAERRATAHERAALRDRLASFEQEHDRLAEQLASAERDRELFTSRVESLEQELTRRLEASLAAAPARLPIAAAEPERIASTAPSPVDTTPTFRTTPPATPATPVAALTPARSTAPSAPGESPIERRVLEVDPTLRDRIQTALATTIPSGRGSVAVVNLFGCDATRLAEMTAAADAGMVVVGYASDPTRGSRILGPLRCFVAPPNAAETSAAVEGAARGNRRTITLSEDIDAFMVAKTALTKAGHSVSMACDEKQALDLLSILRPDTVLVDVRGAGQPAVEFLDALGPESGRILTLLVHGDASGTTLSRLADRMLRPDGLDVNELVKVCRNALPEAGKRLGGTATRPTR